MDNALPSPHWFFFATLFLSAVEEFRSAIRLLRSVLREARGIPEPRDRELQFPCGRGLRHWTGGSGKFNL